MARRGDFQADRRRRSTTRSAARRPMSSMSAPSPSSTSSRRTASRRIGHRRRPLPAEAVAGRGASWSSPSRREDGEPVATHILSLTPFRRIVKDYFMICESYYEAIRSSTPSQHRGDRHGPARPPQRGLADAEGPPDRQDRDRFRHGAAAVHAGLRALLAGMRRWKTRRQPKRRRQGPGAILFMCGMNAIRSPMAEAIARSHFALAIPIYVRPASAPASSDPFVDVVLEEIGLSLGTPPAAHAWKSSRTTISISSSRCLRRPITRRSN